MMPNGGEPEKTQTPEVEATIPLVQAEETGATIPMIHADQPGAGEGRLADGPALPGSRYIPLRHYARGGLGEVFVARDEELGREVALKSIQPQHADNPFNRARFVREAEITGKLEHPGIVP